MSVEMSASHASSGGHKAGNADGRSSRAHRANASSGSAGGSGSGSGATDAAAAGLGFMAILSSVGEADAAESLQSPADSAQDDVNLQTQVLAGATGPLDPAALLAQTGQMGGLTSLGKQPADTPNGSANPADGTAASVAGNLGGTAAGTVLTPADKAAQQAADLQGKESLTKDLQGKESTRGAGLKKQDKQQDKLQTLPDQASAIATVATQKQDPRDVKLFMAMEIHKAMQGSGDAMQAAASALGREEQRSAEKSIFTGKVQDGVAPVTTNGVDPSTSGPLDVPAPITEAGAAADVQVAEQVQYWISKDIQNAELKLDGLGEKPVEVSISMQGNEAHVTFRTDEASARSALESAGAQLKDLLQREGLTLGGVFVGNSGSQGSDQQQERRQRQGARQIQIAPAKLQPVDNSRHAHGLTGRSLDLFV